MARLFTGISIPPEIARQLLPLQSGLPGARWRPPENFHITLCFIGEVDSHTTKDIDASLSHFEMPAFEIRLKGSGHFGNGKPRALWCGVDELGEVTRLANKVETAVNRLGVKTDRRKYTPHVTLAYLKGATVENVSTFVAEHSDFRTDYFTVDHFVLYQSHLGKGASHYVRRAEYGLTDIHLTDDEMAEEAMEWA